MRKAKSIPAETPAEVNTGSQSKKNVYRILVLGAASRRKSKPRQWVVDSRLSNSPAFPRPEPVQTEAVILVFAYLSAIYPKRTLFFTSLCVPQLPGIISRSRFGQLSINTSAVKRRPPIAKT